MSEDVVSIEQVIGTLKKHLGLILLAVFGCTLIAGLFTFFVITPQYSASTPVLVNRRSNEKNTEQTTTDEDIKMISTYKDIITKSIILKSVKQELSESESYKGSVKDLQNAISITSEDDSQVFSINVQTDNPYVAADIANTTAAVFKKKIPKIMNVDNVSVISKATPNLAPVSPRKTLNLVIGVILGLVLGIALAFIREYFDKTVKDSHILAEMGLPSLGEVYQMTEEEKEKSAQIIQNRTNLI